MADKIVNGGLAIIAASISGYTSVAKYIGWGTGTNAPAATDTALQTEASEARTTGTITIGTTNATNDTVTIQGTMTVAGAGKTISEVGLFNASTGPTMYSRSTFTGLALNVGDSITFTISTVVTSA